MSSQSQHRHQDAGCPRVPVPYALRAKERLGRVSCRSPLWAHQQTRAVPAPLANACPRTSLPQPPPCSAAARLCRHCGSTVKLSFAKVARPGLVISKRSLASESGKKLISSFHNEPEVYVYDLECCRRGVDAVASTFSKAGVDHVVRWVPLLHRTQHPLYTNAAVHGSTQE